MSTDTTANKVGRPRKSDEERKRHRVQVAMSDGELRDAQRLAELQDTSVSAALAEAATTTLHAALRNRIEASYTNLRVVRETDETRPCRLYIRSGSRNILGSVSDDPETVAFMQLFAAAPQMLQALKALKLLAMEWEQARYGKTHKEMQGYHYQPEIYDAQAAIAKAEGRAEG